MLSRKRHTKRSFCEKKRRTRSKSHKKTCSNKRNGKKHIRKTKRRRLGGMYSYGSLPKWTGITEKKIDDLLKNTPTSKKSFTLPPISSINRISRNKIHINDNPYDKQDLINQHNQEEIEEILTEIKQIKEKQFELEIADMENADKIEEAIYPHTEISPNHANPNRLPNNKFRGNRNRINKL